MPASVGAGYHPPLPGTIRRQTQATCDGGHHRV